MPVNAYHEHEKLNGDYRHSMAVIYASKNKRMFRGVEDLHNRPVPLVGSVFLRGGWPAHVRNLGAGLMEEMKNIPSDFRMGLSASVSFSFSPEM